MAAESATMEPVAAPQDTSAVITIPYDSETSNTKMLELPITIDESQKLPCQASASVGSSPSQMPTLEQQNAQVNKRGTTYTCAVCAGITSFSGLLKLLEAAHEQELSELRGESCKLKPEKGVYDGCEEKDMPKDGDESRSLAVSEIYKPDYKPDSLEKNLGPAESVKTLTSQPLVGFGTAQSMESCKSGFGMATNDQRFRNKTFQEYQSLRTNESERFNGAGTADSAKATYFGFKSAVTGLAKRTSGPSRRGSGKQGGMQNVFGVKPNLSARQSLNSVHSTYNSTRFNINDNLQQQAGFGNENAASRLLPGMFSPMLGLRSRQPSVAGSVAGFHQISAQQIPPPPTNGNGSRRNSSVSMKRWSAGSENSAMTMMTLPGQNVPQHSGSALGQMLIEEKELAEKVNVMRQLCDSDVSLLFRLWANYTEHMKRLVKFQPLGTWTQDKYAEASVQQLSRGASNVSRRTCEVRGSQASCPEGYCEMTQVKAIRCIVRPGSPGRIIWDLIGALLLMFDVIMIPMSVFNNDKTSFETAMDWITLIFWSFDMIASCLTGYIHNGLTVLNHGLIMRNYLKTWFIIDLIVVGPDWGFTIYEIHSGISVGGGGNSSKLLRALRVLRMCRMLRLVKLKRILVMIRDRIDSENLFIFLSIIKMMVMMLLVNHFLASIWYALGDLGRSFSLANWIDQHDVTGKSLGDRYTVAYHWSLTQFSPASMDVQPHNVWERIYAITVLVCGLVLFSSFVSSVTASITQVRNREGDKSKQFWLLRRYLRQHGIQAQLTFRILRYIEYACCEQKNLVPESSIWVLQLLSHQLRNELNYSVSFSSLKVHPFFECTNSVSRVTMMRLSDSAMTLQSLACNDLIVTTGTIVDSMYMVVSGHLIYVHAEEALVPDCEEEVKMHDWVCEPVLWTEWFALGEVAADTESRVVAVDKDRFGRVVQQEYMAWKLASHYARQFVKWLSMRPRGELTDVFDSEEMIPVINGFIEDFAKKEDAGRDSMVSTVSPDIRSRFTKIVTSALLERSSVSTHGSISLKRNDSKSSLPSQFSTLKEDRDD